MVVVHEGIGHSLRRRPAIIRRAIGTVSLTHIPAVVGSGLAHIDLFPDLLADIVDEKPCPARIRIEGHAKRIAQAPGIRLLAAHTRLRPASLATTGGAVA